MTGLVVRVFEIAAGGPGIQERIDELLRRQAVARLSVDRNRNIDQAGYPRGRAEHLTRGARSSSS